MANKKFYYRNKNKKPQNTQKDYAADTLYTAQQLAMTLAELSLSDFTRELLLKNGLTTASDLVRRTEKDMYKVQGFNKKMLFNVKDALREAGMALRSEENTANAQPQSEASNPAKQDKQERGGKFGLADRRGEQKLADRRGEQKGKPQRPQRPERPERLTEPLTIENWRKFMKGGKWGFSDGFKTVIPAMYDEVFCFKEGLASVEIEGKCGYIDGENNIVVPLDYDIAMSFSEGLAMVAKGEKCGYIDKNNEVIIPFEYDAATPFEGGEAKVKKDGKWATVTKENKLTWI